MGEILTSKLQDKANSTIRYAHIDCLRAIAALMVVLHHFYKDLQIASSTTVLPIIYVGDFIANLDFGRSGVYLFFIISGYVIPHSLEKYRNHRLSTFWINRICRLFPAYWLSIILFFIIGSSSISPMVYFANLTMLQKFFGVGDILGVYWTLAVELVFYALCSILVVLGLLSDGRRLETIFLIITSAGLGAALTRYFVGINIPFAWPMFLSLMLAGAIVRKWDKENRKPGIKLGFAVCGYIAVGLAVSVAIYHDPDKYQKAWFQEFGPWAFSILAFITAHYIYRPRSQVLAFIGASSYSLYLFHTVIGEYLVERMIGSGFIANQPFLLSLIIVLAIMIGFAAIIYLVAEKPGIKLGHFLVSKLSYVRLVPVKDTT